MLRNFLQISLCTLLVSFSVSTLKAQLCTGSLGDPVVNITFGSGSNPGDPLSPGITNYSYFSFDCPQDGQYAIRNQTISCNVSTWHTLTHDHTGDNNGYFMLVNANFSPSDFYLQKVTGLCGNTTYEFAAWILNICNLTGSIQPNITFSIEKPNGAVIKTFNTSDIPVTTSPQWKQYGFYFTTPSDVTDVVLRMTNNAPGGIGNDLALDDITFRPCGPLISASLNGSTNNTVEFCEGDTTKLKFNGAVSQGYNNPVYQWQISVNNGVWQDIAGANATDYLRKPTIKGIYNYRLAVAESGNMGTVTCRVVSNFISVTVHSKPKVNLVSNSPVCAGTFLSLKATISNYSNPTWLSEWRYAERNPLIVGSDSTSNLAGKSIDLSRSIKTSASSAGNYYMTVQDVYGCTDTDSASVIIFNRPTAGFNVPNKTCERNDILFTDISGGPAPISGWKWFFGDGGTSNFKDPVYNYKNDSTYITSLVVTDANGCISDTLKRSIIIHPLPKPDFILPKICLTDPFAAFTDASKINDHTESQFTYLWNFGEAASGTSNNSTIKSPVHSYAVIGNYNVSLQVTSIDGCIKDTTKVFTVNGKVPKADFSVKNLDSLCSNDSTEIINRSTVDFGNIVKTEIWWDNVNNQQASTTDTSPFPGKIYKHDFSASMDSANKTFEVRYLVYSGINCVDETTKIITIHRSPVVSFTSLSSVCIENPSFVLTNGKEATSSVGNGLYIGAGIESDSIFNPGKAGAGIHNIRYIFTSTYGCSAEESKSIEVYNQPEADAGPDKTIIKGSFVFLHGIVNGNNPTFSWEPGGTLDNKNILNPKASPDADIVYTLKVKSAEGCTNQDSVSVKVLNGLFIPNAFTPNGDGLNDVWRIPALDSYPNTEAWIFNRWGQTVFHSTGPVISWDGLFNGKPQAAGTYVYYIDLKPGGPKVKGNLMLVR